MKNVILILMILFVVCSCEIIDRENGGKIEVTDYYPLDIGNYWVYDLFLLGRDSTGYYSEDLKILRYRDSIVIYDTAVYNNEIFYLRAWYRNYASSKKWHETKRETHSETGMGIRDSLNYIINADGEIIFAINHFNDTLRKVDFTWAPGYPQVYTLEKNNNEICIDYGCFTGLNFKGRIYNPYNDYTCVCNNIYAKGIGRVFSSYGYYSDTAISVYEELSHYGLSE